jgi:hypothetical protein
MNHNMNASTECHDCTCGCEKGDCNCTKQNCQCGCVSPAVR